MKGEKAAIRGVPERVSELYLHTAKKLLEKGVLSFDGHAVSFRISLKGGGSSLSSLGEEQDSLSSFNNEDRNPVSGNSRVPAHWNVPPFNTTFVGRQADLLEIKSRLKAGSPSTLTQVVVSGLGGVGKTSLVKEYLDRNKASFSLVWWVSGEYPLPKIRELGEFLHLVKPNDKEEEVLANVMEWLAANDDWLIVFDNANEPKELTPYLPSKGQVLITTRNPHWRDSLVISVFSRQESIDLLTRLTHQTECENGQNLAEALGHLPLALTQAGAYMAETMTSFSDYLQIFYQARKELWEDEKPPEDYRKTVQTTWDISVKRIQKELPGAVQFLYRAAFVSPDHIPEELFADETIDPLTLNRYLQKLQKFSLLAVGNHERTFFIHRLVQLTTKDRLSIEETQMILQKLLQRFHTLWNFSYKNPATWKEDRRIFWHLESFCREAFERNEMAKESAIFLNSLGLYATHVEVDLSLAIRFFNQALKINTSLYGRKTHHASTVLNNLGTAYQRLGDYPIAICFFLEAFETNSHLFGEKNPDVTLNLNNLGVAYQAQGYLQKAIDFFTKALEIDEVLYGENDQMIAADLNNLGTALLQQGHVQKAIDTLKRYVDIVGAAYGEEHPFFATGINNLGMAHKEKRDFPSAIRNIAQALEIEKSLFGEEHPQAAAKLHNLGLIYLQLNDLEKAFDFLNRALKIREKIYKEEHGQVAETLNGLGGVYQAQNNLAKALEFFNRALKIQKKIYGIRSSEVALSLNNVGSVYRAQGNLEAGINYYEQALEIQEKISGEEHPDIVLYLNNLASANKARGNLARAIEYFRRVVEVQRGLRGEDDETFKDALVFLGQACCEAYLLKEAFDCYEKALLFTKKHHSNHPLKVAYALGRVGHVFRLEGQFDEAEIYYKEALDLISPFFGETTLDVAYYLNMMGMCFLGKEKLDEASIYFERAHHIAEGIKSEGSENVDSLHALGEIALLRGNAIQAIVYLEKTLSFVQKLKREEGANIARVQTTLGAAYRQQQDFTTAYSLLQKASNTLKNRFGEEHPDVAKSLFEIGLLYRDEGKSKEASEYLEKALLIKKKYFKESHPEIRKHEKLFY